VASFWDSSIRFDLFLSETISEMEMPRLLEIKGLGADIAAVKKGIGELRAAATELNTEKSGLTAEIKDLTEQLKQHRADLRFEAETLGNSSGDTDTKETKPPVASPEVDGATFPREAVQ
jgi:predicted  nucleic acid-binding Zn-ribbon protein